MIKKKFERKKLEVNEIIIQIKSLQKILNFKLNNIH